MKGITKLHKEPVTICKCIRCGHIWGSRSKKPIRCSHCKSYLWNTPKRKGGDV